MPRLLVITREGNMLQLDGETGLSVMSVIRDGGIDEVAAICGGCCACATCHVYVDESFRAVLPPMGDDEDGLLDGSMQRRHESRLSCQIPFTSALDGLRVTIAPED